MPYRQQLRFVLRAAVYVPLGLLIGGMGCAARGVSHTAPDESKPHISWEIRSGGRFGDSDLVCASSRPSAACVLTASSEQRPNLATVRVYLHAAAKPTSYLGTGRAPFISGADQPRAGEVNATVEPGSEPVGITVNGIVTRNPGRYALTIALDATQQGSPQSMRIDQDVPVTVR
jgi:hypothetical protein